MIYTLTQSLLQSWMYIGNCHEGCEEDAFDSFSRALRREKEQQSPESINGLMFERDVYTITDGGETDETSVDWLSCASKVAEYLVGAQRQVFASRRLESHGLTVEIHGRFDALKAGTIYDIKYLNRSFGSTYLPGKYFTSPQHPIYFFLEPCAEKFVYLVSDGLDLYTETYSRSETKPASDLVDEFFDYLISADLIDIYKNFWRKKS